MNFADLHERVRLELLRRIGRGDLSGTRLAEQAQFGQGHISNFLNRKRGLSLEGLDRVMKAQGMTIEQILPIAMDAGGVAASAATGPTEMVPVVSAQAAAEEEEIKASSVIETIQISATRLSDNRGRSEANRQGWQRFVGVRADAQEAAAMNPILVAGSIAVVDRHYNSMAPYRAQQATLYAVRYGRGLLLRYVEIQGKQMILRPAAMDCPVLLLAIAEGETPSDSIVGRVCMIFNEL